LNIYRAWQITSRRITELIRVLQSIGEEKSRICTVHGDLRIFGMILEKDGPPETIF
jgi:hypothetical protein